jgi:hypothetical protein
MGLSLGRQAALEQSGIDRPRRDASLPVVKAPSLVEHARLEETEAFDWKERSELLR